MPEGKGRNKGGSGKGKGGGMGFMGNCVCVKCGYSTFKKPGIPCMDETCPKCGAVLLREGGKHHKKAVKSKNKTR